MAAADDDERLIELSSLSAIFAEDLAINPKDPFKACIDLDVCPLQPLHIWFSLFRNNPNGHDSTGKPRRADIVSFSRLPPLHLELTLPDGYPEIEPPQVTLSTNPLWLPMERVRTLEDYASELWEQMGCSQIIFAYIDYLQQQIENGFGLSTGVDDALDVDSSMKIALLDFSSRAEKAYFERQTFDCGVCLEPKKGAICYQMERCKHIFCMECLQEFYGSCITEGDVDKVQCMAPACEVVDGGGRNRPSIAPSELLRIPLDKKLVQRYADLKRKKKLEADKSTIYCPRSWCQAPARSNKYPKITNLSQLTEADDSFNAADPVAAPTEPADKGSSVIEEKLAICEDDMCGFAFCRVCKASWHGNFVRCGPRDTTELCAEEQASFDYIRLNTSQCPSCYGPSQKSMGCNHMTCFLCRTHYCYLCGSWLDPSNPYRHFNEIRKPCYGRLWDLEAGDEGGGVVVFEGARALEAALAAVEEEGNGAGLDELR
jgi:E3 ubiquitin-protein ligase RNF14